MFDPTLACLIIICHGLACCGPVFAMQARQRVSDGTMSYVQPVVAQRNDMTWDGSLILAECGRTTSKHVTHWPYFCGLATLAGVYPEDCSLGLSGHCWQHVRKTERLRLQQRAGGAQCDRNRWRCLLFSYPDILEYSGLYDHIVSDETIPLDPRIQCWFRIWKSCNVTPSAAAIVHVSTTYWHDARVNPYYNQ